MKKLFSILGECERRLALAATGTRGGVDDSSARLLGGWAPWKLLALGVLLAGVIMVWPHSVPAQAVCTDVDNPTGTPPTVTISTSPNAQVKCTGLTGGLTLTTVKDSTITSPGIGIWVSQDGTGAVAITHAGTISALTRGILVDGDTVAAERHITIRLVAGSQITTRSVSSTSAHGVYAHIENNAATGDIKITHDGTITARRVGILATNKGTGSVDVTTGKGSLITTKGISAGINASVREGSVKGTVTVTHKGTITSTDEGINVSNRVATGTGGVTVTTAEGGAITAVESGIYARHYGTGAIVVETAKGSKITSTSAASGMAGVYAWISNTASKSNIKITHNGMITAARLGVYGVNQGTGNVDVTTGKDSSIKVTGASAAINASVQTGSGGGTVTVTHHGTITSSNDGIYASNRLTTGAGEVKVITAKGSTITAKTRGIRTRHYGTGAIEVTHEGMITATAEGIYLYRGTDDSGTGDITATTAKDSKITSEGNDGIYAAILKNTGTGNIEITHNGMITAARIGVFVVNQGTGNIKVETKKGSTITAEGTSAGINASVRGGGSGAVEVTHHGMIESAGQGIYTNIYGQEDFATATSRDVAKTNTITLKTTVGSTIKAEKEGILLWHNGGGSQAGQGTFTLTLRGRVMGGNTGADDIKYAGVHVRAISGAAKGNGGTIVIGSRGHVSAQSGLAIKVDDKAGDVKIILEKDEHGLVGHVGEIHSADATATGELTFETHTGEYTVGSSSGVELKKDGTGEVLKMRGDSKGVYDVVNQVVLKPLTGDTKGYEFATKAGTSAQRLYQDRARLYEVLPSMLAGLVELSPYSVRMAVPRLTGGEAAVVESTRGERVAAPHSDMGVWVRLAASEGDRRADTATTTGGFRAQSLSWDVKQTAFEAGLDLPTDDDLVLGVSAHYRQSKATVTMGGTMKAKGVGLGVSATWTDDRGLYVDGQLAYTRFSDIEVRSNSNGLITSGSGTGLAVGVEVGQPMSWANMTVTPRGGLSWSSVDMDAFAEPAALPGAGTVAPDDGQSVQARVGVLAELGPADADTRLYASLDVEHEFSPELDVMAAGTRLTAKVKPTWVRLGVGGAMPLGGTDATMLAGDAFYATAGSGNADFGGGVALNIRF